MIFKQVTMDCETRCDQLESIIAIWIHVLKMQKSLFLPVDWRRELKSFCRSIFNEHSKPQEETVKDSSEILMTDLNNCKNPFHEIKDCLGASERFLLSLRKYPVLVRGTYRERTLLQMIVEFMRLLDEVPPDCEDNSCGDYINPDGLSEQV